MIISECERDLGAQVSSEFRPRKQCIEARNRANRVLELIGRNIKIEVLRVFKAAAEVVVYTPLRVQRNGNA